MSGNTSTIHLKTKTESPQFQFSISYSTNTGDAHTEDNVEIMHRLDLR